MRHDTEPSFRNIENNFQDYASIGENLKVLVKATPDELVKYSEGHFGRTQRLAAIRACEKEMRLQQVLDHPDVEAQYLAVLPTLWRLFDECTSS
jgi:hypothetical protein